MRFFCLFIALLLLSACAVKPPVNVNDIAAMQKMPENWTLTGRIAFKQAKGKVSASLEWRQAKENYNLRLSKLIGGTLLYLYKEQQHIELQVDDEVYRDNNAERLIYNVTGWVLPIEDFRFWVSGQLNPQSPAPVSSQKDETGRLWAFATTEGWQVRYQNYKVFSGQALPHNMTLKKDNVQLKLRVSDWELASQ